jgi:hypothetical protein
LIPFEPKLLPTVQHQIFKLLSLLKFRKNLFSDVETETIKDLLVIVKYAPFLVKKKLSIILDFILFHLDDLSTKKVHTIVQIINCLAKLITLDFLEADNYFDRVSMKCIDILETGNVCFLQCVFATLTSLVRITGYQLILLFRFDFFTFGFEILQRPISFDIKAEVMKFLGCLGAFDLRFIRKINKMRESEKINKNTCKKTIFQLFKKLDSRKLLCESSIEKMKKKNELNYLEEYKNFIQNITRNEIKKSNTLFEIDHQMNTNTISETKPITDGKDELKLFETSTPKEAILMSDISSFESLLHYSGVLMFGQIFELLSSKDFNNSVRIKILKSIKEIVIYLGPLVHKFHDTLYPNLLNAFIIFKEVNLRSRILEILRIFVKNSSDRFSDNRQNINYLLGLIQENLTEEPLQVTLLDILKTLLREFKRYLEHRFKSILLLLLKILFRTTNPKVNDMIFDLLCNQLPQDHFDTIIPKFCFFIQKDKISKLKTKGVLKYFETLVNKRNKCPSLEKFLNNIIRSILSLLEKLRSEKNTTVQRSFFSFRSQTQSEYKPDQLEFVNKSKSN